MRFIHLNPLFSFYLREDFYCLFYRENMKNLNLLLLIFYSFLGGIMAGLFLFPEKQKPKTEEAYSNEEICQAIYTIEGAEKASKFYGIKSVKCSKKEDCQR